MALPEGREPRGRQRTSLRRSRRAVPTDAGDALYRIARDEREAGVRCGGDRPGDREPSHALGFQVPLTQRDRGGHQDASEDVDHDGRGDRGQPRSRVVRGAGTGGQEEDRRSRPAASVMNSATLNTSFTPNRRSRAPRSLLLRRRRRRPGARAVTARTARTRARCSATTRYASRDAGRRRRVQQLAERDERARQRTGSHRSRAAPRRRGLIAAHQSGARSDRHRARQDHDAPRSRSGVAGASEAGASTVVTASVLDVSGSVGTNSAASHPLPRHVRPFQPSLRHVRPLQPSLRHVRPFHDESRHVRPLQSSLLHLRPLHVESRQARPLHVSSRQVRPSHAAPVTSTSPVRTAPVPSVMWSVPRAPSSVPSPVAGREVLRGRDLAASTSRAPGRRPCGRRCSPCPCRAALFLLFFSLSPEATSAALTWSGVSVGYSWSSSATAPDATAAACEVPLPWKYVVAETFTGRERLVDVRARCRGG